MVLVSQEEFLQVDGEGFAGAPDVEHLEVQEVHRVAQLQDFEGKLPGGHPRLVLTMRQQAVNPSWTKRSDGHHAHTHTRTQMDLLAPVQKRIPDWKILAVVWGLRIFMTSDLKT